ncbi:nuclear transport factor 2 family protein [Emcibacter sp. SYSU 3D8]|uniref:nuclear transport factor 2 family protein n=1 Tax=Emcibacter sp. SYSU 3D8 TaxID=3133969 RepID=UPI0031FE473A
MTIEELLEIEEIKQLRIMYSHYFDGSQIDDLAALFTEDAVCEFTEDYGGNWVGRDTIRANYAKFANAERPFSFMHANTNPWIRILSPTEANGRWYLLDLALGEGQENPLGLFGVYDDVYRKVDGKWLIARTRIDFLWPKRSFVGFRSPGVNG